MSVKKKKGKKKEKGEYKHSILELVYWFRDATI